MSPATAIRLGCPKEGELSAFADGRLAESESNAIAEHLSRCRPCEDTLARIAVECSLVAMLRLAGAAPIPIEPECQRMQAAAREIPRQAGHLGQSPDERSQDSTDSSRLPTDTGGEKSPCGNDRTTVALDALPATIGGYRIQSILGEGTYGRVYLALDPDLDRQVALKVPKFTSQFSGKAGGPLVAALLREARTAAKLKHPGIVTIYEAGPDDQVGCYVAMEYVDGKSLKQVMSAGKIPHEQAAKYIAQAAEAVHYAHKQGLVHRDLKPANLLIDADGNVKVADFGLAIFEEEQRKRAGEFAGTLAYCSPEQIRGEVHHLDGRTDIWSLGVILYELLTGRRPFGGPNVTDEILHRPAKPPRQIDDSIRRDVERLCLDCLAKDAAARDPSAQDLADRLRVTPIPDSPSARKWLWIGAGVAAASLFVLAGYLGSAMNGLPEEARTDSQNPSREQQVDSIIEPVDLDAHPFTVHHLFERPPKELFPRGPSSAWFHDPAAETIRMDSAGPSILELGKTNARSFRLTVDLMKSGNAGRAGFYVGGKRVTSPSGHPAWEFQEILLRCDPDGPNFRRQIGTLEEFPGRNFGIGHFQVARVAVAAIPLSRRNRLEISVKNGQIDDIQWRGIALDGLVRPDPPCPRIIPDCAGTFGIVNYAGSTLFQDAEFVNLDSE